MILDALKKLTSRQDLSQVEAESVMNEIMDGKAGPAQVAAYLTALRMKGEKAEEVAGSAAAMRAHAVHVQAPEGAVDTCGTGGDGKGSFNASTAAALIVAGAGVPVAKHGNRGMSSACGSADVFAALGVKLDASVSLLERSLSEAKIAFLFAQAMHPAMRYVAPVRKELGFRTLFNILGPLSNPAGVKRQLLGVADPALLPLMAEALKALGAKMAWLVHGEDGSDDVTLAGRTKVLELNGGRTRVLEISPDDFGLPPAREEELRGGTIEESVAAMRRMLDGEKGAKRNFAVANAACALVVAGATPFLKDAVALSEKSLDSGAAASALAKMVEISNRAS